MEKQMESKGTQRSAKEWLWPLSTHQENLLQEILPLRFPSCDDDRVMMNILAALEDHFLSNRKIKLLCEVLPLFRQGDDKSSLVLSMISTEKV